MKPYGCHRTSSRRRQWGKGGQRTYGALAYGYRYRRAARKRARRIAREEIESESAV